MGNANVSSLASQPQLGRSPSQATALPPPAAGSGALDLAAVSFSAETPPQIIESGTKSGRSPHNCTQSCSLDYRELSSKMWASLVPQQPWVSAYL